MEEVWKDVVGYEGLYKVSSLGNVYSCYIKRNLSIATRKDGYKFVVLRKDGNQKYSMVHRLVAEAFIPNPDNMPVVNHKDENPSNNNVNNLEWCSYYYNAVYNDVHIKRGDAMSYITYAYNENGDMLYEFKSTQEASRITGISSGNISDCCNGKTYTCKNMVWSYKKLEKEDVLARFNMKSLSNKRPKNIGMPWINPKKPVRQKDLNDNVICEYSSTREAGKQLNISPSLIAGVCRGEHKQTHGFVFEYI